MLWRSSPPLLRHGICTARAVSWNASSSTIGKSRDEFGLQGDFADATVIELTVMVGDTIRAEQRLITLESDKVKEGAVALTLEAAGTVANDVLEQKAGCSRYKQFARSY